MLLKLRMDNGTTFTNLFIQILFGIKVQKHCTLNNCLKSGNLDCLVGTSTSLQPNNHMYCPERPPRHFLKILRTWARVDCLRALSSTCNGFLRFISGETTADLLMASMAAEPFGSTYLQMLYPQALVGFEPTTELLTIRSLRLGYRLVTYHKCGVFSVAQKKNLHRINWKGQKRVRLSATICVIEMRFSLYYYINCCVYFATCNE